MTDKYPRIPISSMPLELWYEGPTVVVAVKPPGILTAPDNTVSTGTLLNGLLQHNRWLAEMETSDQPGLVHQLAPEDTGLILVAKSDETAVQLRRDYQHGDLTFSYRVNSLQTATVKDAGLATVVASTPLGDESLLWDIDSPIGDSDTLRTRWLGEPEAQFVLYRITAPVDGSLITVALGERIPIPAISLYTAPT